MIKKLLAILLLGVSGVYAQTITAATTTPNLITSGTTHTWTGVTTGTLPGSYMPGGPVPIYDPATNAIAFSYGSPRTVAQTIAINNALSGSGVQVNGYNYSYDVRNMNGDNRQPGTDTLTVTTKMTSNTGSTLLTATENYTTRFDWTTFSNSMTASTPYTLNQLGNLVFSATGSDNGYWAGYFGPQIRNVNMSLRYSAAPTIDPCITNPAANSGCPGYSNIVTSGNLLSGTTGAQAFAINQALANSGAGVLVHGFNYGFNYYVGGQQCTATNQDGSCSWYMSSNSNMNVNIRDVNNATIYSQNYTYTGPASGSKNVTYLFPNSLNSTTLGTFRMTPSISGSGSFTNMYSNAVYTPDQCYTDPLSSPSCPGYQQALLNQQCPANPLYNSACPGYAQALFTQQCNANQLSNSGCPGYAAAYLTMQCNANPLYSTTCSGYAQAYHDQQCSANPLYATDCTGYTTAYHNQQCSVNPLYATDCPGYTTAYHNQQCSISPLFATDCTGYSQAYLNQQCLRDSLFSTQCEGYKTAYAIKYLVGLDSSVTSAVNSTLTTVVETQRNDPTNVTGTVSAVSSATTTPSATTSATSVSPVAIISTIKPAPAPVQQMAQADNKKDDKKDDNKKEEGKKDENGNSNSPSADNKPSDKPKSNREALAERRREAAQKEAIAKGANLAEAMGKAADLEAQKAVQNVVIQAMGFTPGFDTYNKAVLPDANVFYKPYQVYGGQANVDNRNASRRLMGGSDAKHQEMVDSQYKLGE